MEYRQIDLSAWKQVGEGGLGKTYENPDNPRELLKHNKAQMDDLGTVEREYQCAKNVLELGLPTPDVFEIVQIGDGFGTVSEKIVGKKDHSAFDARAGKFAPFDIIIRNYFIPSTPDHSGLFAQLIHALVEKYY